MSSGERFTKAREYLGYERSQFAEKLGFKTHKIKDIEIDKQKVSPEIAETLEKDFSISGWWLLTGKGQMIQDNNKNINKSEVYKIPLLKSKVSAGVGEGQIYKVEPIDELTLNKYFFKTEPGKDIFAIQVKGTSMEPTIQDGSFVLYQESNIYDGENLYIIVKDNELFVKRLYTDMEGNLHIKSDNPLYPEIVINNESQEYSFIMGKVKQIIPLLEI